MSAGEPFSICRASAELAANENLTGIDVSLVYPSPNSCSTLVRDAAANTVIGGLSVSAARQGRLTRHHQGISQDAMSFLTEKFLSCVPEPDGPGRDQETSAGSFRLWASRT